MIKRGYGCNLRMLDLKPEMLNSYNPLFRLSCSGTRSHQGNCICWNAPAEIPPMQIGGLYRCDA